jgi:hypothetical protein
LLRIIIIVYPSYKEKSLLEELMKPEKTFEQFPYELIKKHKKKRRGVGLH